MKKSKRAGFSKHLKSLGVLFAVALISISCGKNNSSGKSSNTAGVGGIGGIGVPGTGAYGYPGYGTQYGNYTLQQMMDIVAQENPCFEGGVRQYVQIPINMNVNSGGAYIGVTSYGDIAVVQNQGQAVLEAFICPRSSANGQGQLTQNPVINIAENCAVSEISAAQMILGSQFGQPIQVNFRPIYYGNGSQLCQNF